MMWIRKTPREVWISTACLLLAWAPAAWGQLEPLGILEIEGELDFEYDVSGVAATESLLVFAVDEGARLQVLKAKSDHWEVGPRIPMRGAHDDGEIDLEALARDGEVFYATGSHCWTRKSVKPDKSYAKNRERLATVEAEPDRDGLFRFRLDPETGELDSKVESLSLRRILEKDDYLGRFTDVPSKENGVDVEGLAVAGGRLYVGFRGPVLRGGYTPVMVLDFDAPGDYELRFVQLDGRGVRGLARVRDGFLILAGPVGDSDLSYRLYHWDGRDCVPGDDREHPLGRTVDLGTVPTWTGSKAEGVAVLEESNDATDVLIVFDSAPKGNPTRFRISR